MADSTMHVDAKRLREFAEKLQSTVSYYKKCMDQLDGKLSRLHATWRDQEFNSFAAELRKTRSILSSFVEEAGEARRRLLEDAERVESYQRVKTS